MNSGIRLISCVFLATVVMASCRNSNEREITSDMLVNPADKDENAKIEFDSLTYHFGKVAVGDQVVWNCKFKNTGKVPLVIGQVSPSCGCTTIKSKPEAPIAPGESGIIVVNLNTSGLQGQIRKSVSMTSNTLPVVTYIELIGEVVGKGLQKPGQAPVDMERTY
ncbi:MAG: hypothetical protein RL220_414 [Bacteroidota bacterium]